MNLGVFESDSWFALNQKLRRGCTLFSELPLYAFLGTGHAVGEISESLANLYAHKMSIGLVEGVGPAVEPLGVHFSRKGLNVQRQTVAAQDRLAEWGGSLNKDTLLVVLEADNPVTGETYDYTELIEVLEERRIFHLVVSYNFHRYRRLAIKPYGVRVLGVSPSRALGFFGERVKFQPFVSRFIDWRQFPQESFSWPSGREDVQKIEEFEKSGIRGMHSYFAGQSRLYDRAVVYWSDLDGSALRQSLFRRLQIPDTPPGYDPRVEALSLCRWRQSGFWSWTMPELPLEQKRGVMIFDPSILGDSFTVALKAAVEGLYDRQVLNG